MRLRGGAVFGGHQLLDGATAVPAVGRHIGIPKRIVHGKDEVVQGSVLFPDFIVLHGDIAKVGEEEFSVLDLLPVSG